MKNNRLVIHKTNSNLNKKDSNLNFKQALSKKHSKNSTISSKLDKDKPLKTNKKLNNQKSKDITHKQIKPFLTKNDIQVNSKNKNSEKIRNLLKHAYNNNLSAKSTILNNKEKFKNKSTTNLCAPTKNGKKKIGKGKNKENFDNNKSPKLTEFINDNAINNELNKNNNVLKSNLGFLIAKNQNYDDDSSFFNINESYMDYANNFQQMEPKKRNINYEKNRNEYLSEDYSIKNTNIDNNDTNSLITSIININKFLTNEVNHKSINNTNNIIENKNKNSKPRKVYENQLSKTSYAKDLELNKTKEESKNNNNENDKNVKNIINDKSKSNFNINNNYQKEILDKVKKSKLSYTGKKPLKKQLMTKRKFLSLTDMEEDNNYINNILCCNTLSPKITINNKIIKNFNFSPNISSINKSLFNIESDLIKSNNKNDDKERIKVCIAKKYINNTENINKRVINNKEKEVQYEKSTKSNNTNSTNSLQTNNKTNNNSKNNSNINEFNLINENVNHLIINNINNNKENKNINYNIFDDDFYSGTVELNNNKNEDNLNMENKTQLNKYINNVDKFSTKKNNKKKFNQNSSCHFIYPSLNKYNKNNILLNKEKNKINISCVEHINNEYLKTQEDDDNNSKIQEIKIQLKNPSNTKKLNSSVNIGNQNIIKINNSNPNINVVNVQNSTINICKNKINIISSKSDESLNDNNNIEPIYKNYKKRYIGSVIKNRARNKSFIYSSKSPSYRPNYKKFYNNKNKEINYLNNSNDKIINQKVYIKQVFNASKYKTQNNFMNLTQKSKISKIKGKNFQSVLKKDNNKYCTKFNNKNNLNIKMLPIINNCQTSDEEYINMDNIDYDNLYNNSNNNINEKNNNNFYTTNSFFIHPLNKSTNLENHKNSSPKIYIKPSKCIYKKNNLINKICDYSPAIVPTNEIIPSTINNIVFSQQDEKYPSMNNFRKNIINDNDNYNVPINKEEKYINEIEFINNENINLTSIQTKSKAYVKKNKNINYNKNNNKLIIRNKVSNKTNTKLTKYYSYFISRNQINKKPSYISKNSKKPKILPKYKRSFMTKKIYKHTKKIKNNVCYIDKKYIRNKKENLENKEMNTLEKEDNIIKANILDFSLDHNKDILYNNIYSFKKNRIIYSHYDKDYQESVGDINLSFSNDDINTFKCKENTIEAVFNELSNVNTLNNDSEIKVTFGRENINNNNYELSTEGRVINDSFNINVKNKKIAKIPKSIRYEKEENLKKLDKISSVIIYDNEEQNEDIKINFEINNEIENDKNDYIDIKSCKEEYSESKMDKNNRNNLISNSDKSNNINNKKNICSKDVINFAEKLGSIFEKKISNSNANKNDCFIDINVYSSNFNISGNKVNFNNNDIINIAESKCRTYKHDKNKYLEILRHNDLTPFNKLELRINNEKKLFKQNSINNNSINEIESENENNVTFNQNKNNQSIEIIEIKEIKENKYYIKNEFIYLLNIVSIKNFTEIINKICEIIMNKNDSKNLEIKNILTDSILTKSITELKYSFLYIILYKKLYFILNDENKENNFTNIINNSLKKKFEEYINNNNQYKNIEFKNNIFGIINLIDILVYEEFIIIENGLNFLDILYNNYLNNTNNDIKYIYLEANIFLLNKLGKIIYDKKDLKNIQYINNFIEDKIKPLIENSNINNVSIPLSLINKIKNLINIKINNWQLNLYEKFIFNKYKSIETNDIKHNESKADIIDYHTLRDINYETLLLIKNNIINYNLNNNTNEDLYHNLYYNYKIKIYDIIRYYIEICIDYIDNISLIDNCNNYINNVIENYSLNNKKKEDDNIKIVNLLLNIDDILVDNKNMYKVIGYLLYSLINYEIYKIEDLNNFIGKEDSTMINVAIIIKYIIIYCNKDYEGEDYKIKILEEFKQTDLFKSNVELFDIYITNDLLL